MSDNLNNNYKEQILEEEIKNLKKEVLDQLKLREEELNQFKDLQRKYNRLENKYLALRQSTLGRVTIKYWKVRRSIARKKGGTN